MKKLVPLLVVFAILGNIATRAQIIRPFTPRYTNPSVKGNIIYVANSIISTSGVAAGNPGTGEIPPAGTSKDNAGAGINIDIDNYSVSKLAFGSVWNYHTQAAAPANDGTGNTWIQSAYVMPAAWNIGALPVAGAGKYGFNSGQVTCLKSSAAATSCTPGAVVKYTTYYFRNTVNFTAAELATTFQTIQLNVQRNDGIVIYINGVERAANNMPAGRTFATLASADIIPGAAEAVTFNLSPAFFATGANTIAVEVHLRTTTSDNMSFDMQVLGLSNNGTYNSSSADLNIPSCSNVMFAGLYWGTDQGTSGTDSTWRTALYDSVKLKIPGAASYIQLKSTQTNTHSRTYNPSLVHTGYLCFKDITSIVNATNATGTYTVADVVGPIGITNSCGGWTIVIAYSNPSLQTRNLTVFDGSVIINLGDPAVNVPISGFLTPPSGPVNCELGAVVYDGDRGSSDSFAFKQLGAPGFYNLATTIAVPLNGVQDAWNSKISHFDTVVTTRNPAFNNTLGYDASIFNLPNTLNAQLGNSQTGATIRLSSPSENYFVHVLTTSISQYNPSFSFAKSAIDINGGSLLPGDSLRYQIDFNNVGNDSSTNSIILDNIPAGATFIRGSIKINGVAKTDVSADDQAEFDLTNNRVIFRLGVGANAISGGKIGSGVSGTVQFDVVTPNSCVIVSCVGSLRNSARMNYAGKTSGSALFDSSGVNTAGCIIQGPLIHPIAGTCHTPSDTLLTNTCPATTLLLPYRKYAGYTIYSAQPFIPANIYDPLTPVSISHIYYAYYSNGAGCSDTARITAFIIACPDIDDDNDGIPDYVELNNPVALQDANSNGIPNWSDPTYPGYIDNNADGFNDNFDPSADSDNDGIPNFYDNNFPGYIDSNGDGINDNMDKDLDGIPNHLDLDSDNDGIPDVVESYGADTNGDGLIDNYTDTDNDGFSQNVDNTGGVAGSGTGLGAQDFDGDGIPNYLDTDSDNDGIPDVVEVGGPYVSNSGKLSNFTDANSDGLSDNNVNGTALLITGAAISAANGRAIDFPFKNLDRDFRPNPYDLDSDGDGIVDVLEAGFIDAAPQNGIVDGLFSANGWSTTVSAMPVLTLRNTDGVGNPDYLDIDSDDDGIPDNIEGQPTPTGGGPGGYQFPTLTDADGDGLMLPYDNIPAAFGGAGILLYDHDGDGIPDYRDLDSDADGQPDIIEGNDFNLNGFMDDNVTLTGLDTDGDGLDNRFDSLNSVTNIKGTSYRMGTNGSLVGDPTPGTRAPVQKKTVAQTDRDWRYTSVVLPIQFIQFTGTPQNNTVLLNWTIITPNAVEHFEIERSLDNGIYNFRGIITDAVKLNEQQSFSFNDDINAVSSDIIYYRLKVVGKAGEVKYSNVLVVRKGLYKSPVSIMPNPANDYVSVRFFVEKESEVTIRLLDNVGKAVLQQKQKAAKGNNTMQLSGLAKFSNGVYSLQVLVNEEIVTQKLILSR